MKKQETEEKIREGASLLFYRHGIKTVTMDDIAMHLGISKKTIYLYYRDKNLLVQTLTEQRLKTQALEMAEIRKHSENSIEEIVKLMFYLEKFFRSANSAVFFDLQKHHKSAWNSFKAFKEKEMTGFIEENLKRGMKQSLYRKELKTRILARLRLEEAELGFSEHIFPPSQFNVSDVQIALLDHFLHGIVTLKGYKLIDKYKRKLKVKNEK